MSNRYIKNTLNNVKRERLMSITNIFIMSLTFFILGIFITVVGVTQTVLRNLEQQAQVTIFFKDDFTEDKILELKGRLMGDVRITSVDYVSKEDAYNIFKEINRDDPVLLDSVTSSILPASLEVRAMDLADLPKLAEEFNQLDGVEEVRFFEDVIGRFKSFSTIAYVIGFSLVFVFLVVSYAVVLSTLRMTIHSKGTELEIMKLVGATNSYVKMPLIYQGIFYGLVSSFISGALLFILVLIFGHFSFVPKTFELGLLPDFAITQTAFSLSLWFILTISGTILGYLGSILAVKRYLRY